MLLYPQDAELQRAACERLTHTVIEASQRSSLVELLDEVRSAALVPVVINAVEVHWKNGRVLTAAARLLCCLANTDGNMRANVVAAGALPAICVALGRHATPEQPQRGDGKGDGKADGKADGKGDGRHSSEATAAHAHKGAEPAHALCDLCAEICSNRGAPAGSRRAMCEALAATGALRATLGALRSHATHAGVVAAACKVLLAYQEEFGVSGALPSQLTKALRSSDTLATLEASQRRFASSQKIQLGAEWALGVGRSERAAAGRAADARKHAGVDKHGRAPTSDHEHGPSSARVRAPTSARRGVLQPVQPGQPAAPPQPNFA
jgi:hypothetical protein